MNEHDELTNTGVIRFQDALNLSIARFISHFVPADEPEDSEAEGCMSIETSEEKRKTPRIETFHADMPPADAGWYAWRADENGIPVGDQCGPFDTEIEARYMATEAKS